jgi:hypothetical protein
LGLTVFDTTIDWWTIVAFNRRTTTFAAEVDIYGEEFVLAIKRLPRSDEGFAACCPSCVEWVDAARVELKFWAREYGVGVRGATWVWVVKPEEFWIVLQQL